MTQRNPFILRPELLKDKKRQSFIASEGQIGGNLVKDNNSYTLQYRIETDGT